MDNDPFGTVLESCDPPTNHTKWPVTNCKQFCRRILSLWVELQKLMDQIPVVSCCLQSLYHRITPKNTSCDLNPNQNSDLPIAVILCICHVYEFTVGVVFLFSFLVISLALQLCRSSVVGFWISICIILQATLNAVDLSKKLTSWRTVLTWSQWHNYKW